MANSKYDYDSEDFLRKVFECAMRGFTDAETANELDLSPESFCCMKNGNYKGWTAEENARRSVAISKELARGRIKVTAIVRGAYLKAAIGGRILKNKHVTKRRLRLQDGTLTDDEEIQTVESEIEQPPNVQALSNWLYHHDEEWRSIDRNENKNDIPEVDDHGVDIDSWIKDHIE